MKGRDDADLLVRLRRRDPEAAGLLYDRYGKAAYSLAFRVLGDASEAESAVAEATLKCWNRIAAFRETRGGALGVWLMTLTYTAALEVRRAARLRTGEETLSSSTLERGEIFEDWAKRISGELIEQAFLSLRTLSNDEHQALDLAFFQGLNPAELAARMGRTQAEVDKLIQAALSKLAYDFHD